MTGNLLKAKFLHFLTKLTSRLIYFSVNEKKRHVKRDNFGRAELNPNESDENRPGQGI